MAKLVVDTNDVCNIMGLTSSPARALIAKIKIRYGKRRDQYITLEEFSEYTGIGLELIIKHLNGKI